MFKVRFQSEPNHKNTHKHTEVLALDSCSPNWSSFCCNGVLSGSVEAISSLIFPISVCTPVATTTPMARPAAMLVPWAKVMIGFTLRFFYCQTLTPTMRFCMFSYSSQQPLQSQIRWESCTVFHLALLHEMYEQITGGHCCCIDMYEKRERRLDRTHTVKTAVV